MTRLDENAVIATGKDRLGHSTDQVNVIYSHAGDRAQLAASEPIGIEVRVGRSTGPEALICDPNRDLTTSYSCNILKIQMGL